MHPDVFLQGMSLLRVPVPGSVSVEVCRKGSGRLPYCIVGKHRYKLLSEQNSDAACHVPEACSLCQKIDRN